MKILNKLPRLMPIREIEQKYKSDDLIKIENTDDFIKAMERYKGKIVVYEIFSNLDMLFPIYVGFAIDLYIRWFVGYYNNCRYFPHFDCIKDPFLYWIHRGKEAIKNENGKTTTTIKPLQMYSRMNKAIFNTIEDFKNKDGSSIFSENESFYLKITVIDTFQVAKLLEQYKAMKFVPEYNTEYVEEYENKPHSIRERDYKDICDKLLNYAINNTSDLPMEENIVFDEKPELIESLRGTKRMGGWLKEGHQIISAFIENDENGIPQKYYDVFLPSLGEINNLDNFKDSCNELGYKFDDLLYKIDSKSKDSCGYRIKNDMLRTVSKVQKHASKGRKIYLKSKNASEDYILSNTEFKPDDLAKINVRY